MEMSKNIYDKIWEEHTVRSAQDEPTILYIDLHLIHEVTSPQAFTALEKRVLPVRRPDLTVATMDHSTPTVNTQDRTKWPDALARKQVERLIENCQKHGIKLYDFSTGQQGIVHVIGPELGLTQPGKTIVCGDSHTATHGAFGALAFGIGTSEVEHVFATQTLLQNKTKTMAISINGSLHPGVYAKDIILHIIRKIGVHGGTGYTIEYRGSAIEQLSMEGRMSICNMSIEAGARAGIISPDQTTIEYLTSRVQFANEQSKADTISRWLSYASDANATYDATVEINADDIEPMVTWGTHPGMSVRINESIPEATSDDDQTALQYMGLQPQQSMIGQPIDVVFIGSCTNSRIEDLREAANIMRGHQVSKNLRVLIVPGSQPVGRQAEAEGLREIFESAGCEWREAGCSMCIAMNGQDVVPAGKYCASTSNRNFVGRQGKGARTFLMSPAMAAAAAISGSIQDVREFI